MARRLSREAIINFEGVETFKTGSFDFVVAEVVEVAAYSYWVSLILT
jgi:hypothetical protein